MDKTLERVEIRFPAGVDGARIVAPLNTRLAETSADYRRQVTRFSPLLFALVYLPKFVTMQGQDLIDFSECHIALCRAARRWRHWAPFRDIWIAPRGVGKTTYLFLILPLWALAHGHRRYFLAFAYTQGQAIGHLANLRAALDSNILLREDYPGLVPSRGRGSRNSAQAVTTASGAMIAAHGLMETVLGARSGADRPDLIVGDDMEPSEANYSPDAVEQLLTILLEGIVPMGTAETIIQMTGTVTMYRSLIHQAVLHARGDEVVPWVADAGFATHYFPGVMVDPETGLERSLWPHRWPLTATHLGEHKRGTRGFALNYDLNPLASDTKRGGTFWREDSFVINAEFEAVEHVMYADTAVTQTERSDMTAIVIIGVDRMRRKACVEYAWHGRITGEQLRRRAIAEAKRNPTLRTLLIESNQGGNLWREVMNPPGQPPLPAQLTLELETVHGSKRGRLEWALACYDRGDVFHRKHHPDLEDQAKMYPDPRQHDDLLDALAGALRRAFGMTGKA